MHGLPRWLLRQLCEYLGLPRRAAHLARPWPDEDLIAQGREPYGHDYTVRGSTLRWARRTVQILAQQCEEKEARIRLEEVLSDVAWGAWARYGYASGDLGSPELDEPGRVAGSALNRRWRLVLSQLRRNLVPTAARARACAALALALAAAARAG